MESNSLLRKHQFVADETKEFQFGSAVVVVKREKEGWYFWLKNNQNNNGKEKAEYFQTGKSNTLVIQPALPEKPLIFKGSQLFVSPKQKLTFFIKIPLNIQLCYSKGLPENCFREFTWTRLSDSWFGEPDSGEAAFSAGGEYYLKLENVQTNDYEAVCPITVFNNSAIPLELQRLIIRVENLTLYLNSGQIVTSMVEIEYKGKDIVSSANYHYSKIYNGEKQEVIAKPRNAAARSMLKINFHFIKNIWNNEV